MSMRFQVFCPQCVKEGGYQFYEAGEKSESVIEFSADDQLLTCAKCESRFIAYSFVTKEIDVKRIVVSKKNTRITDEAENYWRYFILGETVDGFEKIFTIETLNPIKVEPGTLVTLINQGNKPVGIADHSRGVWFETRERKKKETAFTTYYRLLTYAVAVLVFMQLINFFFFLEAQSVATIILGVVIMILILLAPILLTFGEGKINQKMDIRSKLPWLKST